MGGTEIQCLKADFLLRLCRTGSQLSSKTQPMLRAQLQAWQHELSAVLYVPS